MRNGLDRPTGRFTVVFALLVTVGVLNSAQAPDPLSFDAPAPDHATLFKLFMAAHADVLGGDIEAAWEHHLLFTVPAGSPAQPGRGATFSKECLALREQLGNEISRGRILEQAQGSFKQALASAGSWPETAVFRLKTSERLGAYSPSESAFAMEPGLGGVTVLTDRPRIPIPRNSNAAHEYRSPMQMWCTPSINRRPVTASFFLDLRGNEIIKQLPMASSAAETYLNTHRERYVDLEVLVEAGPPALRPGPLRLEQIPVPTKIIVARALDPLSGSVLHTFGSRPPAARPAAAASVPTSRPATVTAPQPSAASSRGPAPPPSQVDAARPTGASFDAPEIDHLAMFKLYMAAHADVLGSNATAAWEHYLLFHIPKGPPIKNANDAGLPSKECSDLAARVMNEITRQSILAEVQSQFRTALASAAAGPKTGMFLLRTQERLGPYELASGTFAVEPGFGGASVLVPASNIGLQICRDSPCSPGYVSPRHNWCRATVAGVTPWRRFGVQILGASALQRMPMEQGAAEAFLKADAGGIRAITLETVLEFGPVPLRADGVADYMTGKERIPARIVAARALHPKSGAVLHTFVISGTKAAPSAAAAPQPGTVPPPAMQPATTAPRRQPVVTGPKPPATSQSSASPTPAASPTTARADHVFPFTAYRGLLLTVRDQPEVLTDQALIDMAQGQVYAEQNAWKFVSNRVAAGQSRLTLLNPKRPAFTYEWQVLIDTNPTLASGPLLDTFLRTDADWSFVTSDPAWDDRFAGATPVDVFLFARQRIEGRDHRFAAQELGAVYGRHLKMASAKAPTNLSLRLRMPPGAYDFQAKALRFLPQGASVGSGHPLAQQLDLLDGAERYPEHYRLPPEASGRATYMLMGLSSELHRAEPPSTKPGISTQDAPTEAWRGRVAIGASSNPVPLVELLALDRRVQISTVPIDPARAEALARRQPGLPAIDGFTATLFFDAERVVLGERFVARKPTTNAVLLARVKRLDVFDPDGKLITSFSADSLPRPATQTAPPAAPRPTPKPSPSQPGNAERERGRLQQMNEKMNEIGARINRRTEIVMAVQRDTQARVQACLQLAAKATGGQTSPAYEQASKACNDKASQAGACVRQADQARLDPLTPEYQKSIDACIRAVWK